MNAKVSQYLELVEVWRKQNPIRLYRTQHDLTLQNLADLLGEKYHTVYRWESGISDPTEAQMIGLNKVDAKMEKQFLEWKNKKPQRKE